jgi:hypothetical protein
MKLQLTIKRIIEPLLTYYQKVYKVCFQQQKKLVLPKIQGEIADTPR